MQNSERSFLLVSMLLLLLQACSDTKEPEILKYPAFPSAFVKARNVEVFLPPGYDAQKKYDVLYVHDGQNVFDARSAYTGEEWQLDETATRLIQEGRIRPLIIVASWCTDRRFEEYMPADPVVADSMAIAAGRADKGLLSRDYLRFLVEELKPFVDSNFSTHGTPEHTFIMGSSMGALISHYAVSRYPGVFGGAACISTHWPALDGIYLQDFESRLPNPGFHRFYYDYGTVALDSLYEPFQKIADSLMDKSGYVKGKDWLTLKFPGAEHNEKAWQERVHEPLLFLFGKQ